MNSLDANVILRFLLNDLPEQSARAKRLIAKSQCYASDVILTEVIFVLEKLYGYTRPDVVALIRQLVRLQTIVCSEALVDKALGLYIQNKQLSFPDCYAAIEALLSGDSLRTFDKELIKHGSDHVSEP